MKTQKKDESKTGDRLSEDEQQESKQQLIFYNICLIAGSMIILFSLIYLLQNLGNSSIYWIGFLGLFCAIPFFIIYGFGMKSIKDRTNSAPRHRKHNA